MSSFVLAPRTSVAKVLYRDIMTKTSDQTIRLKDIEVFARPNCKIKNPERVERLLNEIINGGTELLQVVTDYDFTLTKQKTNDGRPVMSSFGMFNQCKSLPSAYVAGSNQLYEKYRPIEICPKMTQEEKEPHMIEWWDLSNKLLKWVLPLFLNKFIDFWVCFFYHQIAGYFFRGISFNPTEIEDLVKEYGPTLRDGTQQMLKLTNESSIPVLVFSAGLGDSILAVLRHEQVMYSNVKIVSNFLKYENGIVNGFSDNNPIIHTFNKNETVLEGTEYFEMVQNRKNVILMG